MLECFFFYVDHHLPETETNVTRGIRISSTASNPRPSVPPSRSPGQFPVLTTGPGGYIEDVEAGCCRTDISSLLERGRVLRLRAALEVETRRKMSYAEFEILCKDCGMDRAEAWKASLKEDMQRSSPFCTWNKGSKDRKFPETILRWIL